MSKRITAESVSKQTSDSNDNYKLNLAMQGAAAVILAVVALLLVLVVSNNNVFTYDLTSQKRFTLSPFSVETVKKLKSPINFYIFISDSNDEERIRIDGVLRNYKTISGGNVNYTFVDPRKNPIEAQKKGAKAVGDIVAIYNGKNERLYNVSEEGVTSLIISMTDENKSTIHFLQGHGERGFEKDVVSMSKLKKSLIAEGYSVEELQLGKYAKAIPSGVSNLAIIAPKTSLLDNEKKALSGWLNAGGNLLFAAEMDTPKDYNWLFSVYGLQLSDLLLIDPKMAQMGANLEPIFVMTDVFSFTNPITKGMRLPCIFKTARPVEQNKGNKNPALDRNMLVSSDMAALACDMSDLKSDKGGRLVPVRQGEEIPIVQTVERSVSKSKADLAKEAAENNPKSEQGKESRIKKCRAIFSGDADFLSNELFDASQFTNKDLVMNMFSWMGGSNDTAAIRAKDENSEPLMISQKTYWTLAAILCLLVPGFVFFYGLAMVKGRDN
ncbi:MAG: Gldg family protein [Candidatus Bruticola sp.]